MEVSFVKMQATGNDFVVLDGRYGLDFSLEKLAPRITDRHYGVGADGLIVLEASKQADFYMRYLNADGGETICGNGIRCLARFIVEDGLLPKDQKSFELETAARVVSVRVHGSGESVTVDMGAPRFDGRAVPIGQDAEAIEHPLQINGKTWKITAVSMGNPHCVIFVSDVEQAPVEELGPILEHHEFFPKRTNVEFVEVCSREEVKIRVWERGVGETLACGTGVCASLAAMVKNDFGDPRAVFKTRGGELEARWDREKNVIVMRGPAARVFEGKIDTAQLLADDKGEGDV